jgi:Cu(I)/Ag(I) efflux system membrane fusion protein
MKNLFSNKYIKYIMLVIAGLFIGWLLFHDSRNAPSESSRSLAEGHNESDHDEGTSVWTCSMHPHIRMDKPGDCPICGMDLIPLSQSGSVSVDNDAVHLSQEGAQLANVMTSVIGRQKAVKEFRLYGRVQVDERLLQSQVAHVPGRIERLNLNFTGEPVRQGQVLAEIYSPELIAAQKELLQTLETRQLQPDLYEASRERLKQWKLNDDLITEIENSKKIMSNVKVYSNTSGTVISKNVNAGDYISQGTVLYNIADLSKVWVLFDAYESDLPFLQKGKKIDFTLQAIPGKTYTGNISFIDPVLDPQTRVARVRVEVPNRNGELKPGMFANGIVSSDLAGFSNDFVIPRSAVLWTGKRSIVYVKQPGDEMIFKMREVELGPMLGDSYVVTEGLSEGEEIVTNGTFSVDASAQLEGKPSMMNPAGGMSSTGHDHGDQNITAPLESVTSPSSRLEVQEGFVKQLARVYESYIAIKNALVKSEPATAKKSAGNLSAVLSGVDMKLLQGDAHNRWMDLSGKISTSAKEIASSSDVEVQRTAFSVLSNDMYTTVKAFGLPGTTVYYQFCPMAFNNKGGYWLSEIEEIRNPYFGDAMLTCGETRETIGE